jgi:hypothetical protein
VIHDAHLHHPRRPPPSSTTPTSVIHDANFGHP